MKKVEFEVLCAVGKVETVCICQYAENSGWEMWVYPLDGYHVDDNRIKTSRGMIRDFATLDSAYRFARQCGYTGVVTVESSERA